jgi:hypothetical protein
MFVGVYGNNGIYGTTVASPTSAQSFTISGVQPGTYQLFAFVDLNNNGYFDTGDIVPLFDLLPTITVGGIDMTGQNLTLPNGNAYSAVTTMYQNNLPSWEQYSVQPRIISLLKMLVKVTIMSGPNIPLPYDIAIDRRQSSGSWIWTGLLAPTVGDSYTYRVTYSDGTEETLTASVTGVLTTSNMATPTSPANNATEVSATPTFTWTAPASPPTSYTYQLGVQQNGPWIWSYPNNGKQSGMPSSQLSVLYNVDGSANQPALTSTQTYQWWISTVDSNGNQGQNYASFTTAETEETASISGTAVDKATGNHMPGVSVSVINASPPNSVIASTTTDSDGNFTLIGIPTNVAGYLHLTYPGYVNKNNPIAMLSGPVTGVSINMFTEAQGVSIVHGLNQCASATTWTDPCIQNMSWVVLGTKVSGGSTNAAGVTISASPSGLTIGYNNGSGVFSGSSTVANPGGLPSAAGFNSTYNKYSFTATNGITTLGPVDILLIPGELGGHTFTGF